MYDVPHDVHSAWLTPDTSTRSWVHRRIYGDAKSFHFNYARSLVKQAEKGVEDLVRLAYLIARLDATIAQRAERGSGYASWYRA